jgi:hypothetical protein
MMPITLSQEIVSDNDTVCGLIFADGAPIGFWEFNGGVYVAYVRGHERAITAATQAALISAVGQVLAHAQILEIRKRSLNQSVAAQDQIDSPISEGP